MADPVSSNKNLLLMATGTASGQWGAVLNASVFTVVDQALGSTTDVTVAGTDIALTTSQIQNLALNFTGTLSSNIAATLPANPNSSSAAVGGFFVAQNNSTGAFAITVKTVASGSQGVVVPQGVRSVLYSDGTNVYFGDDAQNRVIGVNGNPNGSIAGTAPSARARGSRVIDYNTNTPYLCTTTGGTATAVWSVDFPITLTPQGYLTASSDATNPVLTGDSVGATTVYYTAYSGGFVPIFNGTSFTPVAITGGQLSLALSASAQASNGIYDVIFFIDSGGTTRIGFSPAWTSAAAGSGSRGTGAGTPQLTRISGILVNAVQQTVNNGASTYTVAVNRGTYVGSVYIDSSAGQVTCHRSYGQSRKFGVWNAYNRLPIILKGGDSTATWTYNTNTLRPSNNNSANSVTSFVGLQDELLDGVLTQKFQYVGNGAPATVGIGYNSTASASGFYPSLLGNTWLYGNIVAELKQTTPPLGISVWTSLEEAQSSTTFYGTETNMVLSVAYMG